MSNTDICTAGCADSCEAVFDRIQVLPLVAGGTRVTWDLKSSFQDTGDYTYSLQVGTTGLGDADDWTQVGFSATDASFFIDDDPRVFGRTQWTHYRIKLVTGQGTYYSTPVGCYGFIGRRYWNIARAVLKRESLGLQQLGQEGILLKRRVTGERCTVCIDSMTDESRNPQCPVCYGTEYVQGYYDPLFCVYAALDPKARHEELDLNTGRGTVNDIVVRARMLAFPQLNENDVWVDRKTDLRWIVHSIQHNVELQGLPLVYDPVELRLASFSDPIYLIEIEGQQDL